MRPAACCTWIFGGEPLAETAARAARCGLDGVELFGDASADPRAAARILTDHGLTVFSLTPADADISHPDEAARRAGLDYYRRLCDFAAELGGGQERAPLVGVHGLVGRIRPVSTQQEEDALLAASLAVIAEELAGRGLRGVFEILNRYESHQVRTVAEGLALLDAVGVDNIALLADAYHMNIEEADPAAALRAAGSRLGLYHAADNHRGAVGAGSIDFAAQFAALDAAGYAGPVVLELNAAGPDPFTPVKGPDFRETTEAMLRRSLARLASLQAHSPGPGAVG